MSGPPPAPWWREPFVWLVLLIPASAVVMGVVLVTVSVRSYDGLVADDYYKRGLEIDRVLARDREARRLGLSATLDAGNGAVSVRLAAERPGFEAPGTVELWMRHPTRAGFDRTLTLERAGPARYTGALAPLRAGRWHVVLESPRWRVGARVTAPLGRGVVLVPADPGG